MKCRQCGQKAVINMRHHKLALCSDHFIDWFTLQTQRTIHRYRMFNTDSRILIAVSGGKDSLALWDVLHRLGYQVDGLYIHLGIEKDFPYSQISQQKSENFAIKHGICLHIENVKKNEGASITEATNLTLRGRNKPCSVCGLTKRHYMNRVGLQGGYDVVVTGHNLDDEAALLFGNALNWQVGYLARQSPILEASSKGFIQRAKPFFRFYERETAAYAFLRGIDYVQEECPYAIGAKSIYYKEVLNHMELKRPGLKQSFFLAFLKAKQEERLLFRDDIPKEELKPCKRCGQPTSAPDLCAFCRTWEKTRDLRAKNLTDP
jgi:uncharacterized protein (TIGR00269 family)